MDNVSREVHESFALVQFSRISSSGNKPLFGSSIGHSHTIQLTISTARLCRNEDLSYEQYMDEDQLIRVEMSNTQFAELITSMNYGTGIPATLRRFNGKNMEDPPVDNKRARHSEEFKDKMSKFASRLKSNQARLQDLLKKQKLSAEDKRNMKFMFENLTTEIENNIPFFERQFEEQMDKTVVEAKGEIEGFITNAVTQTGLEALREEGKMLNFKNKNNEE